MFWKGVDMKWNTYMSPPWWSPSPLGSHTNHSPGDLLVLWVHTPITRLVISWSFGFTHQSPTWWSPGPLGSYNNHCLVISWSFRFTHQSPAWWSPGPLGSHTNHPPGDLLVLWVHTPITRLVISWSFGFTQQSHAWWSPGPLGSHNNHTPGDPPGLLGSHTNHPTGDLLVLWVHTTITRLVISWSFGFTHQSPAWWSPGP